MSCSQKDDNDFVLGYHLFRPIHSLVRGHVIDGHTHHFDHDCIVVRGSYALELFSLEGSIERRILYPGSVFKVDKNVCHRLECLSEQGFLYCMFLRRNDAGEISMDDGFINGKSSGASFHQYV